MKKEYEVRKKLAIVILTLLAVCMAGGLFWYMRRASLLQEPDISRVQELTAEIRITVPPIVTAKEEMQEKPEEQSEDEPGTEDAVEQQGDIWPLTKEEAAEPGEQPQLVDETMVTDPNQEPQYIPDTTGQEPLVEPVGGTVNDDGQIYVPGFGYVPDPGAPTAEAAGSDGDWNQQVGVMN